MRLVSPVACLALPVAKTLGPEVEAHNAAHPDDESNHLTSVLKLLSCIYPGIICFIGETARG